MEILHAILLVYSDYGGVEEAFSPFPPAKKAIVFNTF